MSRNSLYSSIDRRINADQWFRGLSHLAQLLWFRLLTGSHVTPVAGLWPAQEAGLASEFGFTLKRFRELFEELSREQSSNGLPRVVGDWSAGVLWLPNAIHQECNQPSNWKMLIGWLKFVELVPDCETRKRALSVFAAWLAVDDNRKRYGIEKGQPNPQLDRLIDCWSNGSRYLLARAIARNQNQEYEQNQKQESAERQNLVGKFPMSATWQPSKQTLAALETGLIPDWAIPIIVAKFRAFFAANQAELSTDAEWNQRCSKWIFREWNDSSKRPKKPESTAETAEGWA